MKKILALFFMAALVMGAATRTQQADTLVSADATKTWTLPSASDTLDGIAATNTLTHKTMDGATNTWTNIPANTALSSQVPVANGGTGSSTLTSGSVLVGNGTSAVSLIAHGTSGNVLTSNGTTWVSQAPAGSGGGFPSSTVTTVSSNTTLTSGNANQLILVSTSGSSFTITLPSHLSGTMFWFKDTVGGSGGISISASSGNIEGTASPYAVKKIGFSFVIFDDGTNWWIL